MSSADICRSLRGCGFTIGYGLLRHCSGPFFQPFWVLLVDSCWIQFRNSFWMRCNTERIWKRLVLDHWEHPVCQRDRVLKFFGKHEINKLTCPFDPFCPFENSRKFYLSVMSILKNSSPVTFSFFILQVICGTGYVAQHNRYLALGEHTISRRPAIGHRE